MMTLKESYTYQNYLNLIINKCLDLLGNKTFILKTTRIHNIKQAEPKGENKIVETPSTAGITCEPMKIVDLLVVMLDEKDAVSTAIAESKKNTEIDIDKSMAMNKLRQRVISRFNTMMLNESNEWEENGAGYRLNETSGSQERFNYVITAKSEINFDRNDIRSLIKKYNKLNKDLSNKKDLIEMTVQVNYEPKFEMDSTLEELIGALK